MKIPASFFSTVDDEGLADIGRYLVCQKARQRIRRAVPRTIAPPRGGLAKPGLGALTPQRQVQRPMCVQQRPEPEMHIKRLGRVVFRVHDQRVCSNLLSGLQAAVNGTAQ